MIVGVLAFQGDFAEHLDVLRALKVPAIEVRSLNDLTKVEALIIPGGESTVMAQFLEETGIGKEIVRRAIKSSLRERDASRGLTWRVRRVRGIRPLALFGTCAGAILLAKKVTGKNAPKPLGLIDITVDRNAYGTQIDSFEATLSMKGSKKKLPVSFIRAPKITKVGRGVEVLATYKGTPVLVRQGNVLASAFHTEVRHDMAIHELFLKL